MKKIASLLLTALLLAAMLTVFALPAFAESAGVRGIFSETVPNETGPDGITNGGNLITKSGTYSVEQITCTNASDILVIGEGTTITVRDVFVNDGMIIVCGKLNISENAERVTNHGSIKVVGDGQFNGIVLEGNAIEYIDHFYVNGNCIVCGGECSHENGYEGGKCLICGTDCLHRNGYVYYCKDCGEKVQNENLHTGSTLSEGSMTIIVGVAAAVVFGLGGFFIGRKKKKPALADGIEKEDEE